MIALDHVSKRYPGRGRREGVQALDDVTLHVARGEVLGLVGESGSGKSTLVRCLNLLERPTAGRVTVDGTELIALGEKELRAARAGIGMVFQHFNLLDRRTALGNVALPLQLAGVGRAEREERARALLDRVGLAHRADAHPGQLSGGQRQRVALARALAPAPAVLVLDEATSALDAETTASVLDLVRELVADLHLTAVVVSHEADVVRTACTHAAALDGGRLVEHAALAEVARRPDGPLGRLLLPALPEAAPVPEGWTARDVLVRGDLTAGGTIAGLARRGLDVEVLAGEVGTLGGVRVGRLRLALRGTEAARADGERWLAEVAA